MKRNTHIAFIGLGILGWAACFARAWFGGRFYLWMVLSLVWVWSWPGIAAVVWTLYDWASGRLER